MTEKGYTDAVRIAAEMVNENPEDFSTAYPETCKVICKVDELCRRSHGYYRGGLGSLKSRQVIGLIIVSTGEYKMDLPCDKFDEPPQVKG